MFWMLAPVLILRPHLSVDTVLDPESETYMIVIR